MLSSASVSKTQVKLHPPHTSQSLLPLPLPVSMETGPGEPIVTRHAEGSWIWIQLLQPPDNGSSRVFTACKNWCGNADDEQRILTDTIMKSERSAVWTVLMWTASLWDGPAGIHLPDWHLLVMMLHCYRRPDVFVLKVLTHKWWELSFWGVSWGVEHIPGFHCFDSWFVFYHYHNISIMTGRWPVGIQLKASSWG